MLTAGISFSFSFCAISLMARLITFVGKLFMLVKVLLIRYELIMKEVNKQFKNLQHHKIKGRFAYKAKRLASSFNLKDKIEKKYQHNVVYRVDCPDCDNFYIGESGRRIEERVFDHAGRDRNSHVYKHSLATGHNEISMDNVTIINSNFSNYYKRKVSEAIYIKQKRPILNIQDTSVPLKLLN